MNEKRIEYMPHVPCGLPGSTAQVIDWYHGCFPGATREEVIKIAEGDRLKALQGKSRRIMLIEYSSQSHVGKPYYMKRYWKGYKTARYDFRGGYKGHTETLRDVLQREIGIGTYLFRHDYKSLLERLFGDDAESKYKQATARGIMKLSRLPHCPSVTAWHLTETAPPLTLADLRGVKLTTRLQHYSSLYDGKIDGLNHKPTDSFKREDSDVLKVILSINSSADFDFAEREFHGMRKAKYVQFEGGLWFDIVSLDRMHEIGIKLQQEAKPIDAIQAVKEIAKDLEPETPEVRLDTVEEIKAPIPTVETPNEVVTERENIENESERVTAAKRVINEIRAALGSKNDVLRRYAVAIKLAIHLSVRLNGSVSRSKFKSALDLDVLNYEGNRDEAVSEVITLLEKVVNWVE
jgi:hypothetical protein